MIEEKKTTVKKKTIEIRRNSRFDNNEKRMAPDNSRKELQVKMEQAQRKSTEKNLKRIGSKNQIKAYQEIVQDNPNKENQSKKADNPSNNKRPKQVKHLKRIGKQKIVGAYFQSVTQDGRSNGKEKSIEPIITVNQIAYEKNTQVDNNLSEGKQIITSQNTSEIIPLSQVRTEEPTEQILFAHTNSQNQHNEKQNFSINIKKMDSEDENQSSVSPLTPTKKDECIESPMKTDSDQARQNSDIIDGQLSNLINQYASNSDGQSDRKIQELLQEIQKNQNKNADPVNNQKKQDPANYLTVPKNQRSSQTKNSKTSKTIIKKQELKIREDQPEGKQKVDLISSSEIQKIQKANSQQMGEKLQEKPALERDSKVKKQVKKKSFESWVSNKKFLLNKKTEKLDKLQLSNSQLLDETGQGQKSCQFPLPSKKRLLASEGPKKVTQLPLQKQKISKSLVKALPEVNGVKLTQSQVKLNKVKARENGVQNYKSLHQQSKYKILHKQSIATRFKSKVPKLEQIKTQSQQGKIITPVKRNHRQLQVNRCVGQARKIVSKIDCT